MRKITIDFNDSEPCAYRTLGFIGEHNATELVIIPPKELEESEKVTGYAAAFTTDGKVIRSRTYQKGEELTIPLWQQLTQTSMLGVQLEAYDESGDFVGKSMLIPCLRFLPSADGNDTTADNESSSLLSEVAANSEARHTHENVEALAMLTLASNGRFDLEKKVYLPHSNLVYRDLVDSHPMKAITGLEAALAGKKKIQSACVATVGYSGTLESWQSSRPTEKFNNFWKISTSSFESELYGKGDLVLVRGNITNIGDEPQRAWAIGRIDSYIDGALTIAPLASSLDHETPVKGIDYWTEDDKEAIMQDILAQLPIWEGGEY